MSPRQSEERRDANNTQSRADLDASAIDGHEQDQHGFERPETSPHDESTTSMPSLPPPPQDNTLLSQSSELDRNEGNDDSTHYRHHNQTVLEEREMRRKLLDIESSFMPEPSPISVGVAGTAQSGADDTYLVGVSREGEYVGDNTERRNRSHTSQDASQPRNSHILVDDGLRDETFDDSNVSLEENEEEHTSLLETLGSSPTAAAAARTVSRILSSINRNSDGNKGVASFEDESESTSEPLNLNEDIESTPRKPQRQQSPSQRSGSQLINTNTGEGSSRVSDAGSEHRRRRPKYLTSRQSTHRTSIDSVNSVNTDTTNSDTTLGVDYALQSGGAVPGNLSGRRRGDLSRTVSLGSMASGISSFSDERQTDRRNFSVSTTDGGLHTVDEEPSTSRPGSPTKHSAMDDEQDTPTDPATPKARSRDRDTIFPSDTVIAEYVKDIQVPGTFARQFRESYVPPGFSNDKRPGAATPAFSRSGKNLTLKEQSHHIDRLSKENFDLKMRIHFLNEALNKRSEEGIKEMISENVELKSDKLRLQKEVQSLKRSIRDLEKKLKDRDLSSDTKDPNADQSDSGESDPGARNAAAEEEILFLRERVETYETEINRLRSETLIRESEKRKLATMVKSLGDGRGAAGGSDASAREERVSCLQSQTLEWGKEEKNEWNCRTNFSGTGHVEGHARCRNSSTRASRGRKQETSGGNPADENESEKILTGVAGYLFKHRSSTQDRCH